MVEIRQTETFRQWRTRHADPHLRGLIAFHLHLLAQDHVQDTQPTAFAIVMLNLHDGNYLYLHRRGNTQVVLLCSLQNTTADPVLKAAKRMVSRMSQIKIPGVWYDPAEDLATDEAVTSFMKQAFSTPDAQGIQQALGVVVRARGMAQIAAHSGLSLRALYRSFNDIYHPSLRTTLAVMQVLGVDLSPVQKPKAPPQRYLHPRPDL